ncbi:unnamed protein product [Alopecurus aequalis]
MEPITKLVPSPRPWAALPRDLVGEISVRLRDAADFVRLHAVCRPWRKATPSPAAIRPGFLPWPLALCNDLLVHLPLNFACSSPWTKKTSRYGVRLPRASSSGDKNWVASADGTAAWFLTVRTEPRIANLLTGAIKVLPRFPEFPRYGYGEINRRMEKSRGIVYSDGTIFVYSIGNGAAGGGRLEMRSVTSNAMKHEYNYIFESGNELLWATVMYNGSRNYGYTLSVTLHALVGANIGGQMRWVERDGHSLRDQVMFLGSPASFTTNAAHLGIGGGWAYFVLKTCVMRYNLINGVAERVGRVRPGWGSDKAHVWLQPHPAILLRSRKSEKNSWLQEKGKTETN